MKSIRKPSWEDLKRHELLHVKDGHYVLSKERLYNLLEYLDDNGCRCKTSEELLRKPYLTKEEYESIRDTTYTIYESQTHGENDTVSKEMKQRILKGRNKK